MFKYIYTKFNNLNYIINCYFHEKRNKIDEIELRQRLNVFTWTDLLKKYKTEEQSSEVSHGEKILIGFFCCEETSINTIESVYHAFEKDEKYKTLCILQGKGYLNRYSELITEMKKKNLDYCYDFECKNIRFDIVVVHHIQLPPTPDIQTIVNSAKFSFAIPVGVISYNDKIPNYDEAFTNYNAKHCFVEESLYNKAKLNRNNMTYSLIATGNPKFDAIYNACHGNYNIPEAYKKLCNSNIEKVILFTTDHKGNWAKCSPEVSFDLYAKTLFDFFEKNKNIGLLFRPYNTYIMELLRDKLITEEEVEGLKCYCKDSPNIVWDEEADYSSAYGMCDAILADINCGIICSALPTMKPIGIPIRWDMDVEKIIEKNKELLENYYLIYSDKELIKFFEMVLAEKDEGRDRRKKLVEKYVTHFDGQNGIRIKNEIEKIIDKDGIQL